MGLRSAVPLSRALCNSGSPLKIAIILGTSRKNGNTHQLVDEYARNYSAHVFDLSEYDFSGFDYEHKNTNDDFLPLIEKLLTYDHLIFATPVYWYTMSAPMKLFFDRLSDLLTTHKEHGRSLRGKSCSVISTGTDNYLPEGFEQPFSLTAQYLGMQYSGALYCVCEPNFSAELYRHKIAEHHAIIT